ncbi:uncharacterized protein LOC125032798 [Penaeus chinensis]|uniref:uncharacterized protein LOC125032798 n=1 Tax=Penaeus chinensis TaxID=139456 RepID=UPI001FB71FE3|nr:uncharacterized protein LOC125032798 [Penaeus chinensis]
MKSVTDTLREAQALGLNPEAVERLLEQEQAREEREERASEREMKKIELELAEADKRRSHELAMAQLACSNAESKSTSLQMYDNLRLPTFHDGQDEIDSYLQRFERLATLHKWDKQNYHVYLGSVLRGHALKVYVSLPDETVKDYEKLKEALLRAYSVDADMYRRLFREMLPKWQRLPKGTGVRIIFAVDRRGFFKPNKTVAKDNVPICHGCGKTGHIRPQCPDNPRNYKKMSTSVKIPPESKPDESSANLDLDRFESSGDHFPSPKSPNHLPKVCNDVHSKSLETVMRVETRAMTEQSDERKPLKCPAVSQLDIGKLDVINAQNTCPTLKSIREKVKTGKIDHVKNRAVKYEVISGLIYRICLDSKFDHEKDRKQLVVPEIYRSKILNLAHDSLTAGHFSHRKTSHKIFLKFFWPGAGADIKRYCRSCHICQKVSHKGRVKRVPMKTVPVISEPFSRVAIDLVGPVSPCSDRGHRYILTMIDYSTRFPEAVCLKNIDTVTIAESLVEIFSRVGIPKEILSDRGTQFRSDLMAEIHRLLSVKALYTTPYHASCNGAVERLNGVLKAMIKKLCSDHPRDWDRYLPAVLFAYREIPNDSLKFSPFELLYGRTIRGPLTILHELWSNDEIDNEVKTTYQYVTELRSRLEETAKLAVSQAEISSKTYKSNYDLKSRNRKLEVNDEVLVLLPTDRNKRIMQWKGPYPVIGVKNNGVDYTIKVRGKSKLFHINMLKRYFRRDETTPEKNKIVNVCIVDENDCDNVDETMYLELTNGESLNIGCDLSVRQKDAVSVLISEFPDVFTDKPGHTKSIEHVINLETTNPVCKKPYPIPYNLIDVFNKEVDKMLELGIIEPSVSPYCSPVVLVRKRDQTYRFCIDFRSLNDITTFDCEPMPTTEEALGNFVNDKYFTEIDLKLGYWQIPLSFESKKCTAFSTNRGLMQFVMVPFGLKTACATFVRLMRKVIFGLKNTNCYFDNIVIHNSNWVDHLQDLRCLLNKLRLHGLTAGISKSFFGYNRINYLGVVLGENVIKPPVDRIRAIELMPLPIFKKELRSFIRTISYYRKFIPKFANICAPMNELLKKNSSNKLNWKSEQVSSFLELKSKLSDKPILCLPDYSKTFFLRCDASENGIGAVLLQEQNGTKMPIAYASRKLLDREKNFATIEKECLSIVWAINKFKTYIYGKEFVLETDQQPLIYLKNMRNSNGKLM